MSAQRLRFSGEPTQLTKEARSRRVRCKRLLDGVGSTAISSLRFHSYEGPGKLSEEQH
jgi:hypothetical protein